MRASVPSAATVGEIARRLGEPLHRIEYVIRTRGLKPEFRAGHAGIYSEGDVQYIAAELRRIDQEKGVNHG